jgi:PHD/YefM family antitoxin component YafN of YafNO toxin-antitoxin module
MGQATAKEPAKVLEEQFEFSNITELRQDFLRKVEEIQKNPAVRLFILKHGRPQAVMMSADAYDVLRKVVKLFLSYNDGLGREQSINAAINRFEAERSSVPAEVEASAGEDSELAAG